MPYTTATAVQSDFKSVTFGTTTLVTTAAVDTFILEADALINSYVGARWTTPITADAASLALMSLLSRTLVSGRIRGILANKQATNADANQNVKSESFSVSDAMKLLQAIKAGDVQLSGATLILSNAGFFSNNNSRSEQPVFRKGVKQW